MIDLHDLDDDPSFEPDTEDLVNARLSSAQIRCNHFTDDADNDVLMAWGGAPVQIRGVVGRDALTAEVTGPTALAFFVRFDHDIASLTLSDDVGVDASSTRVHPDMAKTSNDLLRLWFDDEIAQSHDEIVVAPTSISIPRPGWRTSLRVEIRDVTGDPTANAFSSREEAARTIVALLDLAGIR